MEPVSKRRRPLLIAAGVVGVAVIAFLAFGVFGVHLLFIDEEVAEAAPTFAATTLPADTTVADPPSTEGALDDEVPDDDATSTTGAAAPIVPTIAAVGTFVNGDHPTSGTANVLTDGGLQRVLRLEDDFATDNGPDLNVYLAPSSDVDGDYIDLGDLKGNIGSQNYDIPADVDLETYDTVVIWCVRFGVAFGSSELGAG